MTNVCESPANFGTSYTTGNGAMLNGIFAVWYVVTSHSPLKLSPASPLVNWATSAA